MITIDNRATEALRGLAHRDGHPLKEAGRLSGLVGMDAVRLPDGRLALGKSVYDGSWMVLCRDDAPLFEDGTPSWRGGRVEQGAGEGFLSLAPSPRLADAFRIMVGLPSPVLEGGEVLDLAVASAEEAVLAVEAAAAPRP